MLRSGFAFSISLKKPTFGALVKPLWTLNMCSSKPYCVEVYPNVMELLIKLIVYRVSVLVYPFRKKQRNLFILNGKYSPLSWC